MMISKMIIFVMALRKKKMLKITGTFLSKKFKFRKNTGKFKKIFVDVSRNKFQPRITSEDDLYQILW